MFSMFSHKRRKTIYFLFFTFHFIAAMQLNRAKINIFLFFLKSRKFFLFYFSVRRLIHTMKKKNFLHIKCHLNYEVTHRERTLGKKRTRAYSKFQNTILRKIANRKNVQTMHTPNDNAKRSD